MIGKAALCLASFFIAWLTCPVATTAMDMDFPASSTPPDVLTIASVTDLDAIRPMIEGFQRRHPSIAVRYHESESPSLDKATAEACREGVFLADVVISSSVAKQVGLVNDGCARPVETSLVARLPAWAKGRQELIGLTAEPAVIVYNKAAFAAEKVPADRFELVDLLRKSTRFMDRIGTYDIASSGVGYFFAFEDAVQATTWGRLIEVFGRNRVKFYCCSADILDRVADGSLYIGYNILGSYALARADADPRIGVIFPSDYTLVMTRTAFISKEARAVAAANLFLEFVLSPEGTRILEQQMRFYSPIDGIAKLAELSPGEDNTIRPIALTPALIVALDKEKRRLFLEQWDKSVFIPSP